MLVSVEVSKQANYIDWRLIYRFGPRVDRFKWKSSKCRSLNSFYINKIAATAPELQHTVFTFIEMWLLFPYALIPDIMYGPSFGMTSVQFVLKFFYEWILKSGILDGGGG